MTHFALITRRIALAMSMVILIGAPASDSANGEHLHRSDLSSAQTERITSLLAPVTYFDRAEPLEAFSGGAGSVSSELGRQAFSHAHTTLSFEEELNFKVGNGLFKKIWVAAPASTKASDGLGPLFNARACQSCHLKDGRGVPGDGDFAHNSLILTLPDDDGAIYGNQLQTQAIAGLRPEAIVSLTYRNVSIARNGENHATLKAPQYHLVNPGNGEPIQLTISPRLANPVIGMGLLEAIHPSDILARHDPEDLDKDGISGRANWLQRENGTPELGRFGWRAETATLQAQIAHALHNDMGLSSSMAPEPWGDCTAVQSTCRETRHGDQDTFNSFEVSDQMLDLLTDYLRGLAVPMRRDVDDPKVLRGKSVFHAAGCAACHHPKFITQTDPEFGKNANQLIWPYTDLLLHDMGSGLADIDKDGRPANREWRTAPLWGIGLAKSINPNIGFLHDGRAATLEEAVLWHGGEAKAARDYFMALDPEHRLMLILFLESL